MEWALLGLSVLFFIVAFIMVQGTRASLAWRKAAAEGDVEVIRDIVDDALSVWRSVKRPKEVASDVWRGVQSAQIVEVGADFVRVSCESESEYKLLDGRWVETKNQLQEGMAITARIADMLLYELPHFKPQRIQIDVYTSFREADGSPQRSCILSTDTTREAARRVDWEEWTPLQIVDELGGRFRLGEHGRPLPIPVGSPAPTAEASGDGAAVTAAS